MKKSLTKKQNKIDNIFCLYRKTKNDYIRMNQI